VEADEKRVKDVHKGVIDLPIADKFDASGLHIGDGAAVIKGFEAAAVAVGAGSNGCLVGKEDFAIEGEIGECALLEDKYIRLIQAVIVVRLEDFDCGGIIQGACHDVPGKIGAVFFAGCEYRLSKELKKGLVFYRAYREVSFWAIEAETCALAAGDYESCDLSGREQFGAEFSGLSIFLLMTGQGRGRSVGRSGVKTGRDSHGAGVSYVIFYPGRYLREVKTVDLVEQMLLLQVAQLVVKSQ